MAHIAVDMTPLLPGGENGGAKLVALELVKGFQAASEKNRLLILTASWNHEGLAFLDGPDTKRLCVLQKENPKVPRSFGVPMRMERTLRSILRFVRRHYREKLQRHGPLSRNGVDALFCPFTAPTFAESAIPVVSLVHDLQHKEYPQFFSPREIETREAFFADVARRASAIVCVSEHTRQSVLRHLKTDPRKTHAVHNAVHSRLGRHPAASQISRLLRDLRVDERPYLFYPANFWPHKNHSLLTAAYGMYVSRSPDDALDLVLTGAMDDRQRDLKEKVRRMGLAKRVRFLGYVPEEQLYALWQGCASLIFPSLYEGFGIPVLEAMQFGKPVLCSNVTSLPEVAGDAALYFDPRKPAEIVQCIERVAGNPHLAADLIQRGRARLEQFRSRDMVEKYLECIQDVIRSSRR
jgi:glycosyltransferase involved in cell wall biosynthesis